MMSSSKITFLLGSVYVSYKVFVFGVLKKPDDFFDKILELVE